MLSTKSPSPPSDVNADFILQTINSDELRYLQNLEKQIGTQATLLTKGSSNLGVEVRDNRIIGLKIENVILEELPKGIEVLEYLETLVISNAKLKRVPNSIGILGNLTSLTLDSNQLQVLPDSIGKLRKLNTLWLDNNPLNSLPETFGQLIALEILGIRYTPIMSFPSTFGRLLSMKQIYVMDDQQRALEDLTRSCSDLVIYPVKSS